MDNLGFRETPYKISEHGQVHKTATYFLFKFDAPPSSLTNINEECGRDVDIVRRNMFKIEQPIDTPCTLDEELQPPAYRKEVQKMVELSKRKERKPYDHKSGLNYYPFTK